MLVLTRNANQSIIIGKELITIKILEISGQSVRIGVDAPQEFTIHREEIYNRIAGKAPPLSKPPARTKEPVMRTIDEPSLNEVAQNIANRENPHDIINDLEAENNELKDRIEELEEELQEECQRDKS